MKQPTEHDRRLASIDEELRILRIEIARFTERLRQLVKEWLPDE